MFDDRVGDHVALSVRERTWFFPNLPPESEAHVPAKFFGDDWSPFGHGAFENRKGTEVNTGLF